MEVPTPMFQLFRIQKITLLGEPKSGSSSDSPVLATSLRNLVMFIHEPTGFIGFMVWFVVHL